MRCLPERRLASMRDVGQTFHDMRTPSTCSTCENIGIIALQIEMMCKNTTFGLVRRLNIRLKHILWRGIVLYLVESHSRGRYDKAANAALSSTSTSIRYRTDRTVRSVVQVFPSGAGMSIAPPKKKQGSSSTDDLLEIQLGVSLTAFTKENARQAAKDIASRLKIQPR